jgi:hypothetical protein
MVALAEVQVLPKAFVNKQPNLVLLEVQATPSNPVNKLAVHVLVDYQLHTSPLFFIRYMARKFINF